jgi:hypothetical protein
VKVVVVDGSFGGVCVYQLFPMSSSPFTLYICAIPSHLKLLFHPIKECEAIGIPSKLRSED